MTLWTDALKIWNASASSNKTGSWAIPRKGTPGHDEVRKIMEDLKSGKVKPLPKAEKPAKAPKEPKPPKEKAPRKRAKRAETPKAKEEAAPTIVVPKMASAPVGGAGAFFGRRVGVAPAAAAPVIEAPKPAPKAAPKPTPKAAPKAAPKSSEAMAAKKAAREAAEAAQGRRRMAADIAEVTGEDIGEVLARLEAIAARNRAARSGK